MNLETKLITEPQLIESPYLSKKTGLNISIKDNSCTSTGTHKLKKSIRQVQEAKTRGQGIFLFINPVIDSREDSDGSGIDALELASAVCYPESQVVCVVDSKRPYLKSEPINGKFPNRRKRIVLGVNLNEFLGKEQLENYFKDVITGKTKFDKSQVIFVGEFLKEKGLDVSKCLDLTNLEDCSCYKYSPALVKQLEEFDYLVGSAGTCERALGQIMSIQNEKLKHIIVFPFGHVLDPFHRYEESDSKRVQAKFRVKTHDRLLEESVGRDDVIYKSAGLFFGGKQAKELFVDKAIEKDSLDMKSSSDGAIGFSILKEKDNPAHKRYFEDRWLTGNNGLKVFNAHEASERGFNYIYPNPVIPYGSKVCIVNTGISNNLMLNKLIEEGVVE